MQANDGSGELAPSSTASARVREENRALGMNWTWNIRSRDGGMNGLEFTRATTAGGFARVLIHAAPAEASVEVFADDGGVVARGDVDQGGSSP